LHQKDSEKRHARQVSSFQLAVFASKPNYANLPALYDSIAKKYRNTFSNAELINLSPIGTCAAWYGCIFTILFLRWL